MSLNRHDILDVEDYIESHIKYPPIHISEVGSFMWNMGNEESEIKGLSDHDIFVVYQASTVDILKGKRIYNNLPCKHDVTINGKLFDFSFMEVGHFINLIKKGNINAIWGLTSSLTYKSELDYIIKYVNESIQLFDIIPSGVGMAMSQLKDMTKRAHVRDSIKSLNGAYRTLKFVEKVVDEGIISYEKYIAESDYECEKLIEKLNKCRKEHNFDSDEYLENALLELRMKECDRCFELDEFSENWCRL